MPRFLLTLLLLSAIAACSESKPADLKSRVERLGKQIRCPVCRGVPIIDSPAELAVQMMTVLREQVAAGKSDEEILTYFEERYGEWALLNPKPEGLNLAIWLLPALVLAGGAAFIVMTAKKRKAEVKE